MNYHIIIIKEADGRYSAQCIELPAAISFGKNIEEAARNTKEAIELVIEEILDYEKELENANPEIVRIETVGIDVEEIATS